MCEVSLIHSRCYIAVSVQAALAFCGVQCLLPHSAFAAVQSFGLDAAAQEEPCVRCSAMHFFLPGTTSCQVHLETEPSKPGAQAALPCHCFFAIAFTHMQVQTSKFWKSCRSIANEVGYGGAQGKRLSPDIRQDCFCHTRARRLLLLPSHVRLHLQHWQSVQ